MHPTQLVTLFGSQSAAADAFGITPSAVNQWFVLGRIPPLRLYQLPQALARHQDRTRSVPQGAPSAARQTGGPTVPARQESSHEGARD